MSDIPNDVKQAILRLGERVIPDSAPIAVHPRNYERACDLLGLPRNSLLTHAQFYEAARIEFETMCEADGD